MISLLAKEAVSGRGDSESDLVRLRIKRGCEGRGGAAVARRLNATRPLVQSKLKIQMMIIALKDKITCWNFLDPVVVGDLRMSFHLRRTDKGF